jgi:hypothetical protein
MIKNLLQQEKMTSEFLASTSSSQNTNFSYPEAIVPLHNGTATETKTSPVNLVSVFELLLITKHMPLKVLLSFAAEYCGRILYVVLNFLCILKPLTQTQPKTGRSINQWQMVNTDNEIHKER